MSQASTCLPPSAAIFADPQDDIDCMMRLKAGDASAMELLLARYQRAIHGYLYRMVQNSSAAEDLTQDTFLRVYRARLNYQVSAKFSSWLYRIATNLAMNWIRDHRRDRYASTLEDAAVSRASRRLFSVSSNPERLLLREERLHRVRDAVAALPERQRAAVLLHKYGGLDYSEIARVLDCTISAVRALMARAFVFLRSRLAAEALPA